MFFEKRSGGENLNSVKETMFGDSLYSERVQNARETVDEFLEQLWAEHGGYKSIEDIETADDAQDALVYLGKVVKFSRATLTERDSEGHEVSQEGIHRIVAILRDIARGRAVLNGRTEVQIEDVQISARVALSTMPKKRRSLVQALLNPSNGGRLSSDEVEDVLDVSRPTAINRMEEIAALGIADIGDDPMDGRDPKSLWVKTEFKWPDSLDFPKFGGNSS